MKNKTIIIATPNTTQRNQISTLIGRIEGFSVVALTGDLMNTYNQVEARLPTAVLISEALAILPEFEVMRALFSALDVRWLVLTAPNKAHRSINSNGLGSDLFSVPGNASAAIIEGQLRSLTRSSQCKPINDAPRRRDAPRQNTLVPKPSVKTVSPISSASPAREPKNALRRNEPIILIGASTGGVDALLKVLSSFPVDCPPTMIVQHTGVGFGVSLAELLNRQCAPKVSLIEGPVPLQRGLVSIGAGNKSHLVAQENKGLTAMLVSGRQVSGHLPSVDVLFRSFVPYAPVVSAAILTGMGRDGAEGLRDLYRAGATTYAQDEASSVVYGMPRAAVELGAAQSVLSIDQIGPALLQGPKRHSAQHRKVLQ